MTSCKDVGVPSLLIGCGLVEKVAKGFSEVVAIGRGEILVSELEFSDNDVVEDGDGFFQTWLVRMVEHVVAVIPL